MNKITKVELQKRNKSRVNIYVDEDYAFSCDAELVYTYKLRVNEVIDLNSVKEVVFEDNYIKAKRDALRTMERSFKTEKQIYNKLMEKGYEERIIEKVMLFLENYNFVDDKKYVDAYVKDKIGTQGRDKIYYSLAGKGVDSETIKQKLESVDEEVEFEGAKKLAIKKYNTLVKRENDTKKISQKLNVFLASKGYSWEIIRRVTNQIIKGEELDW